jgi:hypothetical protein
LAAVLIEEAAAAIKLCLAAAKPKKSPGKAR